MEKSIKKTKPPILEAHDIAVQRSKTFTLSIEYLAVYSGDVICLAGANGSGKTTLVETLTGLLLPQEGAVLMDSRVLTPDDMKLKRLYGFAPDDDSWLVAELTPKEYFALLISLYRRAGSSHDMPAYVAELAKKLLFTSFDQQIGNLSHGNKKKVQLIGALLHKPRLLIVDELRNGLDPIAIKRAEDLLKACNKQGMAIVAATHDLWWAERFAKQVIMIQAGEMVLKQRTAAIVKRSGSVENRFLELFTETA